jgi:NTP pyrophosphatase (non-canonical NTP hydrolase)
MINKNVEPMLEKIRKFVAERDWMQFHNHKDMAEAMVIEAAEFLEIFRFKKTEEIEKYVKDPVVREELSDELADVLWYVLELADNLHIDLDTALTNKLAKTALHYPIHKSKGKAIKYTKL